MQGIKVVIVCLVLLLLWGVSGLYDTVYPQEGGELGWIDQLQGDVYVKSRVFWFIWKSRRAYPGMFLMEGERIVTGEESWVEGEAPPGVFFHLGENSSFQLKRLIGEEQRAGLQEGQAWIKLIRDLFRGIYYEIETPSAVAGVRGTCFGIRVTREFEEFLVKEGEIEVITAGTRTRVVSMQKLRVEQGRQAGIREWDHRDREDWEQLKGWEKKLQEREEGSGRGREGNEKGRKDNEKENNQPDLNEKGNKEDEEDKEDKEDEDAQNEVDQDSNANPGSDLPEDQGLDEQSDKDLEADDEYTERESGDLNETVDDEGEKMVKKNQE